MAERKKPGSEAKKTAKVETAKKEPKNAASKAAAKKTAAAPAAEPNPALAAPKPAGGPVTPVAPAPGPAAKVAPKPRPAPAAPKRVPEKAVRVTQVRSPAGRFAYQRATLRGLGLDRINRSSVLEDTPAVRGMIERVRHLVRIDPVA